MGKNDKGKKGMKDLCQKKERPMSSREKAYYKNKKLNESYKGLKAPPWQIDKSSKNRVNLTFFFDNPSVFVISNFYL